MKNIVVICLFAIYVLPLFAQEQEWKITGKPIVQLFANYQAGLGSSNQKSGFELGRVYVGYAFSVTEHLSGKVVFNVGSTKLKGAEYERVAYVKNAMLTWQPGRFSLDFGLVGCQQWSLQQKFWECRYIMKSFQDEYKFGSAADLGLVGKYKFAEWISADLSFVNGEGYKKLNVDNKYRYALGVTLLPLKGLQMRVYGDIYSASADTLSDQQTLAFFMGYKNERFSLGAEYNLQYNTHSLERQDQGGCSVYGLVGLAKKISLLGRYDFLGSAKDWNALDGQQGLVGLQYQPIKQLKLAAQYHILYPHRGAKESFAGLNIEFKL